MTVVTQSASLGRYSSIVFDGHRWPRLHRLNCPVRMVRIEAFRAESGAVPPLSAG